MKLSRRICQWMVDRCAAQEDGTAEAAKRVRQKLQELKDAVAHAESLGLAVYIRDNYNDTFYVSGSRVDSISYYKTKTHL